MAKLVGYDDVITAVKLYITLTSPYARMARIVVGEKNLQGLVDLIVARTRTPGSPYYVINPSGRVPYLVTDDGMGIEDSALICEYLDHLDNRPRFDFPVGPDGWEGRRLNAMARSMLDGLAVWAREYYRPADERSPTVINHEADRSQRMLTLWNDLMDSPFLSDDLNIIQITLACALDMDARIENFNWRADYPRLSRWADGLAERPSIAASAPPRRQ